MSFCSNTINSTTNENISDKIHKQKLNNPKNIIIGHLNINSLRNKIDFTRILFGKNIDILLLSETKLDQSFPERQFSIDGFRTFRKDRNQNGGGLIIYVNQDLACKVIDLNIINTEYISIELTAKNKKWLIIGIYKPPTTNNKIFINSLTNTLSKTAETYEHTILIGDFNMTIENPLLNHFLDIFDLSSLITEPTCFKSDSNPSCIDLILTNSKNHFMKSSTFETGISDFHKLNHYYHETSLCKK